MPPWSKQWANLEETDTSEQSSSALYLNLLLVAVPGQICCSYATHLQRSYSADMVLFLGRIALNPQKKGSYV